MSKASATCFVPGRCGRPSPGVRRAEEQRLDQGKVVLAAHAVHQDGPDHAAPADEADEWCRHTRQMVTQHGRERDLCHVGRGPALVR